MKFFHIPECSLISLRVPWSSLRGSSLDPLYNLCINLLTLLLSLLNTLCDVPLTLYDLWPLAFIDPMCSLISWSLASTSTDVRGMRDLLSLCSTLSNDTRIISRLDCQGMSVLLSVCSSLSNDTRIFSRLNCYMYMSILTLNGLVLAGFSSTMFQKIGMFYQPPSACMTLSYHSIDWN